MSSLNLQWRAAIAAGAGVVVMLSGAATATASATSATSSHSLSAAPGAVLSSVTTRTDRDSSWFVDPRTPKQRRAQLAVPSRPEKYSGRLRETRAVYRTRAGALAVPMRWALGHQLVRGQALTLDGQGLFDGGSAVLTSQARAQLRRAAGSLTNAASIRCEGYADYGSTNADSRTLSKARAKRVCATIADLNPGLATTAVSYGSTRPAIVGGKPAQRDANRRVVIQMTSTRPTKPTPPVGPSKPDAKVPGAPTLVDMTAYEGVVHYSFKAPTTDGGAPITGYQVSTGGAWSSVNSAPSRRATLLREPCNDCENLIYGYLTGVPDESTVDLRVRAVNRIGAGAPSNTLSATVIGLPSAPTGLTVTGDDHAIITTFDAPTRTGGTPIYGYEITYDGGLSWAPAPTIGAGPWTITSGDRTNGTTYQVAVRALNGRGYGPATTATEVLVATVPDAPWLDQPVDVYDTDPVLTFTSPELDEGTDGGSPITGYEITYDGGLTWSTFLYTADPEQDGAFSFSLSDLTPGTTYKVTIRAVNAKGNGAMSKTRTLKPAVIPGAPPEVSASADGTTVTLSVAAPTFDGGNAITAYEVSPDGLTWTSYAPATTITLTNQPAGTRSYQVRAVNQVGHSAATQSDSVTITVVVPNAPTITNYGYYGAGQQVAVSFTAGSTNGATVTGYQMSVAGGPWLPSASVINGNQAMFDCPSMSCGWNYGSSVRLRAVTDAGAFSDPSVPYASNPI
ncbi:fibronectin type III domain-containing protein [Nocardioides lianchengensis]|uniref:Fibronectin type III domain-containing protein n=1 Tax=Nocardioides lianchengensis TaxID=1045774 RepID=A0A1G6SZ00_9ACTN|nr:fibronectin type III domain-containing protein [Nocardioides lianchengensis]NYG10023.1 titin [Nocardioides lianchengensis]SDD21844.1 Fibronectin type III domain-containing protein [Nocardioides lianchengensis]